MEKISDNFALYNGVKIPRLGFGVWQISPLHTAECVKTAIKAFEISLKKLGLEYLDLYLIHWPAVARWHDDWREINRST